MAESWDGLYTEKTFQLLKSTSCVQVYVGSGDDCWTLHSDLLCQVSTFFKAALSGGFKEADEKRVTLKEDDPAVFQIFVAWLYTGEIKGSSKLDGHLEKAWIIGDKLGAPAFQDCTMIILVNRSGISVRNPGRFEYIYGNTAEGSLLRELAVDTVVRYYGNITHAEAEWMALFSRGGDFVVDVMKAFLASRVGAGKSPIFVQSNYLLSQRKKSSQQSPTSGQDTPQELGGYRTLVDLFQA